MQRDVELKLSLYVNLIQERIGTVVHLLFTWSDGSYLGYYDSDGTIGNGSTVEDRVVSIRHKPT